MEGEMKLEEIIKITSLCELCTHNNYNNGEDYCKDVCDDRVDCDSFEFIDVG
jgi:hypothetical protein